MRRVWTFGVVIGHPLSDPGPRVGACLKGVQIHALILQGSPQTLNHAVVASRAFSIHADLDLRVSQHVDPTATGELRSLDALLSVKQRSELDLSVFGGAR